MVVYDKKQPTSYLNGEAVRTGQVSTRPEVIAPRRFGSMAYGWFEGVMDEIQVYSRALTQTEVRSFVSGETAYDPNPAHGQTDVPRDADLNWAPGDSAGTHNVYVGNSLEEVESATVPTAQGLTDTSYDPGRLDFLETVFWRVDEVNATAPFAERIIVNQGSTQSMPFAYDNAFGASEATLTLDGQHWTASGVQTLAVAFHGTADNTGQLYVKINNTKVLYDLAPADIAVEAWQAWNIDLTGLAALQNVTRLTIGLDGATAAGTLYIHDIRFYPLPGALVIPAEPDN